MGSLPVAPGDRAAVTVRRIQPSRGLVPIDMAELWRFRELLYFLVWRDIKARYRQTFLGPLWGLVRPLVTMVIFTAIFGNLAGIDSGSGEPYALFVFAGLVGWTYFSTALTGASGGMLNNQALVTKAYFPRVYAPSAAAIAPIVDLGLSLVVMGFLFVYFGEVPSLHVLALPGFLVLALLLALGAGLWLASASVRYRDVPFALPFVLQIWMYLTPIIYPVTLVPEKYRWILALNPLTAVVEGFRWSLLGTAAPTAGALAVSCAFSIVLLFSGLLYFRRVERTLADMM